MKLQQRTIMKSSEKSTFSKVYKSIQKWQEYHESWLHDMLLTAAETPALLLDSSGSIIYQQHNIHASLHMTTWSLFNLLQYLQSADGNFNYEVNSNFWSRQYIQWCSIWKHRQVDVNYNDNWLHFALLCEIWGNIIKQQNLQSKTVLAENIIT